MNEKLLKKEIKELQKAIKKKKRVEDVYFGLYLLLKTGDEKEARKFLKEVSKKLKGLDPEKAWELAQKAASSDYRVFFSELRDFGKLLEKLFSDAADSDAKKKFSEISSSLFKALLVRDFVPSLLERGDADVALFYLNQVEKLDLGFVHFLLGWAYEQKSIVAAAKTHYEKAVKLGDEEAKRRLAAFLLKQGEFKKAASLFEELGEKAEAFRAYLMASDLKNCFRLSKEIKDSALFAQLAERLVELKKWSELRELIPLVDDKLRKALEALMLHRDGKLSEAAELAASVIKDLRGRLREEALKIIAESYEKDGKWKEITILLAPMETTGSLSPELRLTLAEAYCETKDHLRALKILASLVETDLRKKAKRVAKKLRDETEDERIKEVADQILAEDSFFKRLKEGLFKSKAAFFSQIDALFRERGRVDVSTLEDLEEVLISADVGVEATQEIIEAIRKRVELGEIKSKEALLSALEEEILRILKKAEGRFVVGDERPFVVMVVGVNGTGKTTTIGKLAKRLKDQGFSVLLAAGDTFRAAAIEQLEEWGRRVGAEVIKQKPGADPSGVVYDAISAAKARGIDVVIIDTAGRLHTKSNLMEELKKMARIAGKSAPGAPHEVLLVLDAVVGQNAISQAKLFSDAIPITGIVLTKLDGTAKGGVIIAIAKLFSIPIKFIGVGERVDDLQDFNAERFVDALFER